jgi:hypothetical protein
MHDATLTSLSKIEVGQTVLVTDVPGLRGFARPKDPDAIPLRVTAKTHVPAEWTGKVWTLTLSDGTETTGRYGTTHVYVVADQPEQVTLTDTRGGRPTEHDAELVAAPQLVIGDLVYGLVSATDDKTVLPARVGDVPEAKLFEIRGLLFEAGVVSYNLALKGGYTGVGVHATQWLRPKPGTARFAKKGKKAKQKFASDVELDLAVSGTRRVHVDPDGSMHVVDWTGGDVTERTPKGRLVHIAADGVLTILEDFPEEDDAPTHKPAESEAEIAGGERCPKCKGYGVVRKTGSKAGEHYRTAKGAEDSTIKGNSDKCPVCKGATLLVRAA